MGVLPSVRKPTLTLLILLLEQAKRYALEQEIIDLQSQVDKIKLVPGGVWGGSEAAGGKKESGS